MACRLGTPSSGEPGPLTSESAHPVAGALGDDDQDPGANTPSTQSLAMRVLARRGWLWRWRGIGAGG